MPADCVQGPGMLSTGSALWTVPGIRSCKGEAQLLFLFDSHTFYPVPMVDGFPGKWCEACSGLP